MLKEQQRVWLEQSKRREAAGDKNQKKAGN
jgi:hypothetical protein